MGHTALTFIFAWAPFLANKSAGSEQDFERLGIATAIALITPFVVLACTGGPVAVQAAKEILQSLRSKGDKTPETPDAAETPNTADTPNAGDATPTLSPEEENRSLKEKI